MAMPNGETVRRTVSHAVPSLPCLRSSCVCAQYHVVAGGYMTSSADSLVEFFGNREYCHFTTAEIGRMSGLSMYENRRLNNIHDNLEHMLREGPHVNSGELVKLKRMRAERHVRDLIAQAARTGELPTRGFHAPHL